MSEKITNNTKEVTFSSLVSPAEIICQTQKTDRDEILKEILEKLKTEGHIDHVQSAYQAVLNRENEMPTIIAPYIALPHARIVGLTKEVVGIVTSKEGFPYNTISNIPIKLMVLILVPKTSTGEYLQTLRSLAKIFQDPESAIKIAELTSPQEVWNFLNDSELYLPNYITAHDIMRPIELKLHEHDTLEHAINLFIRNKRLDLPVVDNDNNLIGVVTSYELLKVCLPDYILWMDDLTPILNFEPFADILRNENKTWLAEIMTSDYATIDAMDPAIQAAKEITRKHVNQAYVIENKKLVGAISLNDLLQKILRE